MWNYLQLQSAKRVAVRAVNLLAAQRECPSIKWKMCGMQNMQIPNTYKAHSFERNSFNPRAQLHLFSIFKDYSQPYRHRSEKRELDIITQISRVGAAAVHRSQITCSAEKTHLPDGTKICCNSSGDVIFADYASGVKLARHENYVICTNAEGEHWLRDKRLVWYKID